MALLAIWVDREHAKLFQFSAERVQETQFTASHAHQGGHDQLDHLRKEILFFKEFVSHLIGATEILILGPGVAKHHFRNFLTEHHPELVRKIVACEQVDHPTDAQISAQARKFFSTELLSAKKE